VPVPFKPYWALKRDGGPTNFSQNNPMQSRLRYFLMPGYRAIDDRVCALESAFCQADRTWVVDYPTKGALRGRFERPRGSAREPDPSRN
jgi:hypothetical protein